MWEASEDNSEPGADIGPADPDHWSDIRSLHALAFRRLTGHALETSQCEAFIAQIYSPDYTAALQTHDLQVARYQGRIIGSAGWLPTDDRGTVARITSVFVSPFYTRLGVGRRLVTAAEARARGAGFRAFSARAFPQAVSFFEASGYSRSSQGVQSIGTENGIPVVFMRKHDASPDAPGRGDEIGVAARTTT